MGNILVGTTWASVTPTSSLTVPTITSFSPAGGPAGTPVTINGTNFIGATEVTFNGVTAGFSVDSSIQITATVPAGATAGLIQVTTPEGIAVSQDIFLLPTATVTMPTEINEGATATGTVTLTEAPASDEIFSLTSSSPADLVVPSTVTVATGFASVDFDIEAPLDGAIDTDVDVTVTQLQLATPLRQLPQRCAISMRRPLLFQLVATRRTSQPLSTLHPCRLVGL